MRLTAVLRADGTWLRRVGPKGGQPVVEDSRDRGAVIRLYVFMNLVAFRRHSFLTLLVRPLHSPYIRFTCKQRSR